MLLNHHLRTTGGPLRLGKYVFISLKHQYEQWWNDFWIKSTFKLVHFGTPTISLTMEATQISSKLDEKYRNWNFCYNSVLVGWSSRSKYCRSHFKFILYCFFPIISLCTWFYPNRIKNTEIEYFCDLLVLLGWSARSKYCRSHPQALSNTFFFVYRILFDLCTNFELNWMKFNQV